MSSFSVVDAQFQLKLDELQRLSKTRLRTKQERATSLEIAEKRHAVLTNLRRNAAESIHRAKFVRSHQRHVDPLANK
jgi:hypothetical protein